MPFDFNIKFYLHNSSEETSWSDWINVVIALFNLLLVCFIFLNQLRKDKADREFQIKSKVEETKLGWFKEIIILPNLQSIFSHFENLQVISLRLNASSLNSQARLDIDKEFKKEFSDFSHSFISILYSINLNFANKIQQISDNSLEEIQNFVLNENIDLIHSRDSQIVPYIKSYRNNIITSIYLFEVQ